MAEERGFGQPITTQPGQHGQIEMKAGVGHRIHSSELPRYDKGVKPPWMALPAGVTGCPRGLEYLTQVDQLIVKQQVELFEVISGFEMRNRYKIFNSLGQQVFYAVEESGFCHRICCGRGRGFKMHITDNNNWEVMTIDRPFKCCAGCCWCADDDGCSMEVYIRDSEGQPIGHVMQRGSKWKPHYLVLDGMEQPIGRIRGPCCICSLPCCGDVPFPITDADETTQIGEVTKQWSGVCREYLTDADTFSLTFPLDMDPRCKAAFIGACFLVDYMFFEKDGNNS